MEDEEVYNILYDALDISLSNKTGNVLVYVTPLLESNVFRWSRCFTEDEKIIHKKNRFRHDISCGNIYGYSFPNTFIWYPGGVKTMYFDQRELNFSSYERDDLMCLLNTTIVTRSSTYGKLNKKTDDGYYDFADIETIYFLLVPKYKIIFSKYIQKKVDVETKEMYGELPRSISLQSLSSSLVKNTCNSSFIRLATVKNDGPNENILGKTLLFFEDTIVKEKGKSRYFYSGRFPLHILGLMRKTSTRHPEDCTVFIEEDSIKESVINSVVSTRKYKEKLNSKRTLISRNKKYSSLFTSKNFVRYFLYGISSEVGYVVGGEFAQEYYFNIIVVRNLHLAYESVMETKYSIYEMYMHRTIGIGPIVRLNDYDVGIHIINYNLHIDHSQIYIPKKKILEKSSCKRKCNIINKFCKPRLGDTTKRRRKRYDKMLKQFAKRKLEDINNLYDNYVWKNTPPNIGHMALRKCIDG